MVAHLARCQLDPAMPRASIETLLHAFVPAAARRTTRTPTRSTRSPARPTARRSSRECFGDEAAWIAVHPPGLHARAAGRRGGARDPGAEARRARQARPGRPGATPPRRPTGATIDVDQPRRRLRQRAHGRQRAASAARADGALLDDERARSCCASCCRRCAARCRSERPRCLHVDTSPRVARVRSAPQRRADLVTVGAAVPGPPGAHQARAAVGPRSTRPATTPASLAERIAAARRRLPRRLPRLRRALRRRDRPCPPTPTRASCSIQHVGLVGVGPAVEGRAAVARPLPPRDRGDGRRARARRLRVATRGELRDRVLAARALQALAGAAAAASCRAGRARHRRRGRHRPRRRRLAAARGRRASSRSTSTATARATPSRRWATRGAGGRRRRHRARTPSPRAFAAAVERFGGVDIVVSNAGLASSAPIEDTTLAEWNRNHAVLGTGYFLVAREAFRVLERQGTGGSIVFVASKNALVAGQNAAAYSSAKAAELHLARCLAEEGGPAGIRVNTVNPDAVLQGSRIWDSSWREERAATYGIAPDELEEHYRARTTLGVNIVPEDIAEAVLHFASGRARARAPATCSTSTAACPRPTRAERRA